MRLLLCNHGDEGLWPRQRDDNNCIGDVMQAQHSRAYLEHYTHAEAIVRLFCISVVSASYYFANTDSRWMVQSTGVSIMRATVHV